MSENKITIGFMAELATPVGKHTTELWEATQDALYESDTKLELNYEGTLVFSRDVHEDAYNFNMQLGVSGDIAGFISRCAFINLPVKPETIEPFFAHWYNGSDSPMSDTTLAEFNEAK